MNKILPKFLLFFVLISSSLYAGKSPVGNWRTIDDKDGKEKSVVEIYERNGKIFGKIINLKNPNDENGKPKACSKCEGEDKNKPIVGLTIIKNLSKDGDEYSGGTILDPSNGKIYKCTIQVIEEGKKLKVRGFIGFSMMGRNQYWFRK